MDQCLPSMRTQTDVRVTVEKDMMKARRRRMVGWIRAELVGGGAQQRAWGHCAGY